MDVEYRGRAAYLPDADTVVVADLHIGRSGASAVEAPIGEYDGVVDRLLDHLDVFDPDRLVVAGDVLHVHGNVPTGASRVLGDLVTSVGDRGVDLVLVRGNHDTILDRLDVVDDTEVVDEFELPDGTVVCHGHDPVATETPRYVVGHEHPALEIEGARHACFLVRDDVPDESDVLVLPAFSLAAAGTRVNDVPDAMSPVVGDLGRFRPVVVGTKPYEFPPLRELSRVR